MRLPSWREIVSRFRARPGRATSDWRRRDFARLSLRRLEDRRVLNATSVGMGVTISDAKGAITVDATHAAGGQNFDVSLEDKNGRIELEIGDNGAILYEEDVDKIASITFRATADNNSLTVDFSHGDPIPTGGINFVAVGAPVPGMPADALQFVNGTVNNVAYSLTNPTDGSVQITAGSQISSVEFSGAPETITDTLNAASRSFSVGAGIPQVQLAAAPDVTGMSGVLSGQAGKPDVQFSVTAAGQSLTTSATSGMVIDFVSPTASLDVTADPQGSPTVDIRGLGAGFSANLTIAAGSGAAVDFSAATSLGTGNLAVSAGSIEIDAPVTTTAGTIDLSATQQLVISPTGALASTANTIDLAAPSITQQGVITDHAGSVRLDAGPGGTLNDSGTIDASSPAGGQVGGSVDLLGKYVALIGQAQVNVAGSAGGGTVRIGGDYHGATSAIENAAETYVGQNVTIDADAIESGNGGRIVVWSDQATWFYGQIDARGGANGGDGGFVEISSARNLTELGLVDLSAAAGQTGSLLLDPQTITLVDTAPPAPNDGNLPVVLFTTSPGSSFTISEAALENSNANIILQATNTIAVGNLTASDVVLLKPGVSITLETRNDATQGDSATGGITLGNTTIQTQGNGTITLEAGVNADSSGNVLTRQGAANIQTSGLITAGGAIIVEASRNVTILGGVNSSGGAVAFTADSTGSGTGNLFIGSGNPMSVATGGNSLTLKSATLTFNPDVAINTGSGTLFFETTAGHSIGIGNGAAGAYQVGGFASLTAGNVVIGGTGGGDITVNGTSGALFVGATGTVELLATDGNHSVTFIGSSPASFSALLVQATAGIVVNQGIVTRTGDLSLDGNFGNQSAAGDTITFAAGVTLTSAGALVLQGATVAGMPAAGALTLSATNGVTIQSSLLLSSPAAVTINADRTGAGIGVYTQVAGTTLNTNGGSLTVLAADVNLAGSLNTGAGSATLAATNQRTMAIGGSVAGSFTLDEGELGRIAAANLFIGQASSPTTNGSILVGTITAADLAGVPGTVTFTARGHAQSVTFSGASYAFPSLVVRADNGIAFTTPGSLVQTAGNLSLNGDVNGTADGQDNISFAAGMKLVSAGSLSIGAVTGGMTGAGALELDAAAGVNITSSLTTAGALVVNADTTGTGVGTFAVGNGNPLTVNTTNSPLTVTAGQLQFTTDVFLNSGTGSMIFQPTAGHTVGLGNAAGQFTFANLSGLTAGSLTIGGLGSGNITVDATSSGVVFPGVSGTTTLLATAPGRTVTFQGSSGSTFNALDVVADGGIVANAGVATAKGNLSLTVNSNATSSAISFASGVVFSSAGSLTLLDNNSAGAFTGAGALTLQAANGLFLGNSLTTAGATTLNADNENVKTDEPEGPSSGLLQFAPAASVNTNNGALNLVFEALSLGTTTTLASGTATTTLAPVDGVTIGVGNAVGQVTIDGTALTKIHAANLTIGGSQNGNITVDGVTAAELANVSGTVTLLATAKTGSVAFVNNPSVFTALAASAGNGIVVQQNLTTTTGNLSLNGDSDNKPAPSNPADNIVFSPGVTLTSAGSIRLQATTGGMTDSGALTLTALSGVTIASNLTTNGATTINADDELGIDETETATSGLFTLAGGATLDTTGKGQSAGNALVITAANLNLGGFINSGAATTTLTAADGNAIHIGTPGTGFNLTGAELQNITAAELDIGSPSSTGITDTVDGITAAQSANVGKIVLGALEAGDKILFTGGASTFRAFTGFADADISVNAALSTTPGDLFLQSNNTLTVNSPISTLPGTGGVLTIVGGVVVNSSITLGLGNVTLIAKGNPDIIVSRDISPNGLISATTIDLEAQRDVIVDRPLQTTVATANIILIGDRNHTGVGGVWITSAGFVSSAANVTIEGSLLHGTEVAGFSGPVGSVRIDANANSLINPVTAAGNIVIESGPAAPPGSNVFIDGSVVSTGNGNVDVTAQNQIQLGANLSSAGGNITLHSPTVLTAAVNVSSNAGGSGGGNIAFDGTVDSAASTHEDLTLAAGTGAVSFASPVGAGQALRAFAVVSSGSFLESLGISAASFDVNAAADITLNGSVAVAGLFTANADSDHSGAGVFTVGPGVAVTTQGNTVNVTAADVNLLGTISSGAAAMNFTPSTAGATIGIGSAGAGFSLSNADIGNIVNTTGLVTIGSVANLGGAEIGATEDVNAHALSLDVLTGTNIAVGNHSLTTSGNLTLVADADGNGTGAVSTGTGRVGANLLTVRAAQGIALNTAATTLDALNSLSGNVTIDELDDLVLDQASTPGAGIVAITAGGAILTGSNGTLPNIAAGEAALSAADGIGANTPLATAVGTLAAANSAAGNVQIANNVGGTLTIGTVGSLAGVQNSGGGSIAITNAGAFTVDSPVIDNGGGNVALTAGDPPAVPGDLTINAHVYALGGNGNIVLNAGHDLVVNPSGSNPHNQVPTIPDIQSQGSGQILGTAQDKVLFANGILIQTGVGSIVTLSPALENVVAPEVTAQGAASVSGDFGNPGAHNFTITVDWSDGTVNTFQFTDPGSFTFTHTYHLNPNAANASQPIPITVTVFDDPNSTFIGLVQPAVALQISPTNVQTTANGSTAVQTQATVPGTGFFWFISFAAAVDISELRFTPPPTLALSPPSVVPLLVQSQAAEELPAGFESTAVEERSVIMHVLDPAGKVLEEVKLAEEVLDDLPRLFRQLPDGHYRFFLQEPGEQKMRLLLDVNLRGGKPADEIEAGQDKPAAVEQAPAAASRSGSRQTSDAEPAMPNSYEFSYEDGTRSGSRETSDVGTEQPNSNEFGYGDARSGSRQTSDAGHGLPDSYEASHDANESAWAEFGRRRGPAAVAAGALAACAAAGDWPERVDALLAAKAASLSKAARLKRKFRRAVGRSMSSRFAG